uniref:Platelet and endothelial cell adhesion molecule 1 n=1 Tax=Pipistrellus kuhlii TaxID=59472 RepID=A0A7J7U8J5_PIPKU|nr:platelet and endothelial cell adhesion molecule 1 [Pipistrellus kuhlii]
MKSLVSLFQAQAGCLRWCVLSSAIRVALVLQGGSSTAGKRLLPPGHGPGAAVTACPQPCFLDAAEVDRRRQDVAESPASASALFEPRGSRELFYHQQCPHGDPAEAGGAKRGESDPAVRRGHQHHFSCQASAPGALL